MTSARDGSSGDDAPATAAADPELAALARQRDEAAAEGTRLLGSGAAIGVATALSTVLLGATCPLCVVGVPALLGWGVFERVKAGRLSKEIAERSAAAARGGDADGEKEADSAQGAPILGRT